ncbi:Ppx/GppA phosphatase family protein [Azohydromonas caseinilytica]|uniref:Ppx/GppA family phosphatase n=1 Tax=Azohydromonas caseinilytica TaxID=2728836 RepID=A0A848FGL6_9BURK|nr:Ppx/GppA phosphatase family protein [Azohydromonas caseinilytica]NML18286.1 Ppx/GppA family phosphatase [Azohydromonas caseinilytica]
MNDAATSLPLAAIDMGSNSFRLEIGQLKAGRYQRLDSLKEVVRLGGGLDAQGFLREEAAERGLQTLRHFRERLAGFELGGLRAVATQTLREARNRDEFLVRASDVLGAPVEVISGREEARLIFIGVAHLQPSMLPRLVIDIGGRSTELVIGRGHVPGEAESFQVGSVSLSMRYFSDGRLTAAAFEAARVAAQAEFEEAETSFEPRLWQEALGSSGTAGAVSLVLASHGLTDGRITPSALNWCIERCIDAGHVDRLQLRGLRDDRRPVIAGGLAILSALMREFGIKEIAPAKGALRQGVIVDLHERQRSASAETPDLRDASVAALQQQFHCDLAQARRVHDTAQALHRDIARDAGLDERRELGWACALHEIGRCVSHHDYHRHSAYLMAHVDAAGFSQSQQRRIGELILAQRGGLKKVEASLARRSFARQALCLRLAAILCHARRDHSGGPHLRIDVQSSSRHMLRWEPDTLPPDPRTLHLLREEIALWAQQGHFQLVLKG